MNSFFHVSWVLLKIVGLLVVAVFVGTRLAKDVWMTIGRLRRNECTECGRPLEQENKVVE